MTEVVTGEVDVVELVTTAVCCVVVVIEIVEVVVGVVDIFVVEVDELQDASTIDATIRKLSATQINPFFILPPIFLLFDIGRTINFEIYYFDMILVLKSLGWVRAAISNTHAASLPTLAMECLTFE